MRIASPTPSRRNLKVEWAFLALFGALFLYALVAWIAPTRISMSKPGTMVALSAALMLQPVAILVRPKSRGLFYGVLFIAILLAVAPFLV